MDGSSRDESVKGGSGTDGSGTDGCSDKSARALLMEIRTIFHLVDRIVAASIERDKPIPREKVAHLLYLAKTRLDELSQWRQKIH